MALVRVKIPFAPLGDPQVWPEGRIVDASHPVARKHASLFEPVEAAAVDVEQATAAPGEKRSTPRRSKAKPAKAEHVDAEPTTEV